MSFREWTEHYEKEQEAQRSQIGDLTKIVHSLSADVRTLVENQRGMFSRINKPQGPIIAAGLAIAVSAIGVLATFITLTISPIKDELTRMNEADLRYRTATDGVLTMLADNVTDQHADVEVAREAQRWIEKELDRQAERVEKLHEAGVL
jgi:hypothetical protein